MAFAVVLYFDASTEKKILESQKRLENAGIAPVKQKTTLRPHITLAIFENMECADCECKLREIVHNLQIETIEFISLGIFLNPDKVLYLSPIPSSALMKVHRLVHKALTIHTSGSWTIYEPGKWVPHCTIANDLEEEDLRVLLLLQA